jgi:hypothetical protein
MVALFAACEGVLDEAVLRRLARASGVELGSVFIQGGKASLDAKLPSFQSASKAVAWLVLRDLDRDAICAPELVSRLVKNPTKAFRLHIAVRSLESWLIADSGGIARLLKVSAKLVPSVPDDLADPKAGLLEIARRSRSGRVRKEFLPEPGGARVGPAYTARLLEFVGGEWDPHQASLRSPSLRSLVKYLARVG